MCRAFSRASGMVELGVCIRIPPAKNPAAPRRLLERLARQSSDPNPRRWTVGGQSRGGGTSWIYGWARPTANCPPLLLC